MEQSTRNQTIQKARALLIVGAPLLGTIAAIALAWNTYVFWTDILIMAGMYTVTVLGIGIGYHRMLTHDGFKGPAWLRGLFLILGSMAWEGAPIMWASTHIKHHAHSDEEDDPHSPLEGFWHSHLGWIFDLKNFPDPKVYAPHLLQDPVVRFVDRYAGVWMGLALLIPFALGGWTGLLWGGVVRIFLTTHVTWSVNSICHTFGQRAFETTDESRNEWIVGLLAFGEGWHNNHHAFPRSAFHGLRWWQFDLSGLLIAAMERAGLVWDVQRVSADTIEAQRIRTLSMQESLSALREQLIGAISHAQQDILHLLERYGSPQLSDAHMKDAAASCEAAAERLAAIRAGVLKATHLKKQKLQLYMMEVQQLAEQARTHAQPAFATADARG